MREIKFRGWHERLNKWVYGYYTHCGKLHLIHIDKTYKTGTVEHGGAYEVDPATVGQFTGLTDKDDNEIYEGDIVAWNDGTPPSPSAVRWDSYYGYFVIMESLILGHACKTIRVIGNVHDNPDLLEVSHD